MSAQVALVARVVAETVGADTLGEEGLERIQVATARRVDGALSGVPAQRVATAAWLIEATGRDGPDALDLLVEAAKEGLREVACASGWDVKISKELQGRVEVALRGSAGLAG